MDGFHDLGEEKIESKVGKKSASLGFSFPSRQFSLCFSLSLPLPPPLTFAKDNYQ
jgi:hypothetical protein